VFRNDQLGPTSDTMPLDKETRLARDIRKYRDPKYGVQPVDLRPKHSVMGVGGSGAGSDERVGGMDAQGMDVRDDGVVGHGTNGQANGLGVEGHGMDGFGGTNLSERIGAGET
jgi:hypothetical protein